MDIALWIVTGILAVAYAAAGAIKAFRPKDQLQPMLPWVEEFAPATVKFIGVMEFLGALGLVLPWATGILPVLTPLAATGLVIVQALALVFHLRRRETQTLPANIGLLLAAAFVAVFRFLQL